MMTMAQGQGIAFGRKSVDLHQALAQFNADVAAWNKRCAVTRSAAEDAWCKKERARIDAKKKELIALGAIPR